MSRKCRSFLIGQFKSAWSSVENRESLFMVTSVFQEFLHTTESLEYYMLSSLTENNSCYVTVVHPISLLRLLPCVELLKPPYGLEVTGTDRQIDF